VATIMVADFSGMLPLRNPLVLTDNNAQYAENCWLYTGAIRGFRHSPTVYNFKYADTQDVYRIPTTTVNPPDFSASGSLWLEFPDPYMAGIRNPTVGDQWNRYYFFPSSSYASQGNNPNWPLTSPGPQYGAFNSLPSMPTLYTLGIPYPTSVPGVTPSSGNTETRAYVYTWVSAYGEEGAPSPATVATGATTGTWTVIIPAAPPSATVGTNLASTRLYRTVTDASGNTEYYQVVELPGVGAETYSDSAVAASITANQQLTTINYTPPPAGLQGVVMMANGIAAGFANEREVWFSAAYQLHAWPASYALAVEYPIVGLTADGASLNIITEGTPYIASGVTPDTMTVGKITAFEPCLSRGSIVSAGEGGYYASPNGVQLVNSSGTTNVTIAIMEKEFFNELVPEYWAAGKYGMSFVAFIKGRNIPLNPQTEGDENGFVFDQTDANVPFTFINAMTPLLNCYPDELSGQLFYLTSQSDSSLPGTYGQVAQWNPPVGDPGSTSLWDWKWKSKQFRFTFPQQFMAFMIYFEVPPEVSFTPGVRNDDQAQVFDPTTQYLIVRVYADGAQLVVREVQVSGEVILIPHGSKWTIWEVQMEGVVEVKFFKMSSSVKELKTT